MPFMDRYALLPPEQAAHQALGPQLRGREDDISQVHYSRQHGSLVNYTCTVIAPCQACQEPFLCWTQGQL